MKLSITSPIRNKFAEEMLAELIVQCPLDGCCAKVPFVDLTRHTTSECAQRLVPCTYGPLGCDWNGLVHELDKHVPRNCDVASMQPSSILALVVARNTANAKRERSLELKWKSDAILTTLLSKKCADLTIHNVVIPSSGKSGQFSPVGIDMVALLDKTAAPNAVRFTLRCTSSIRRKTVVNFFVLLAAEMPFQIPIFTGDITFTPSRTYSEKFALDMTAAQASELYSLPSMTLRIGALDCTPGDEMVKFFDSAHEENETGHSHHISSSAVDAEDDDMCATSDSEDENDATYEEGDEEDEDAGALGIVSSSKRKYAERKGDPSDEDSESGESHNGEEEEEEEETMPKKKKKRSSKRKSSSTKKTAKSSNKKKEQQRQSARTTKRD